MQLHSISISFFITLVYLFTNSYSEITISEYNNEVVSKLIDEFDRFNNIFHGIYILLDEIKEEIQFDDYLVAKFDVESIYADFNYVNKVINTLEYEFYTVNKTIQMYKYNKLLHNAKRLKALLLLNSFISELKGAKDLKVALENFHNLVNIEPDYYVKMFKDINQDSNDDTLEEKTQVDIIDEKKLDLIVQNDLRRPTTDMNPDNLINNDSLNLDMLLNRKVNVGDGTEHLNLKDRWRIITTMFKEPFDTSRWNSMLGVELFISANGNPFILGQFLWLEIVHKYYEEFFLTADRKLLTWGNILHAKDNVRLKMVHELCGIQNYQHANGMSLLKRHGLNNSIDIHCQALELLVDQINYMESIYQKHFSYNPPEKPISDSSNDLTTNASDDEDSNDSNTSDDDETASNSSNASFMELPNFGFRKKGKRENLWYSIYPYRLYGTRYDEDVFKNPYTPTEPMDLQTLIDIKYNGIPKNTEKYNYGMADSDQVDQLEEELTNESNGKDEENNNNPESTSIPKINTRDIEVQVKLLLSNTVRLLFTPQQLAETFVADAQAFLTALYMYREEPIYAFYFHDYISFGFEALYNTESGDSAQLYKSLKNNIHSCLNKRVDKISDLIDGKVSLKMSYSSVPRVFSLFDGFVDRYCKDYLGIALFFIYNSVGYTNLEKAMLLLLPGDSSPKNTLFSSKSYLLRDAVMLDKNWSTLVLMLRLITLRNGIKEYVDMKNTNVDLSGFRHSWNAENLTNTIIKRCNMTKSTYSSILLERSLNNTTLEKLVSSIKFILHYNTFMTLDNFSKKADNVSLIEAMNRFIGAWTKYGYTKSKEEMAVLGKDHANLNDNKLFNWMDKDYINLGAWNEQLYGLILWYLERFLQQPHVKQLIQMHEIAPKLYKLPNYIQLAMDSLTNLKMAKDKMIMMSSITEGNKMNLWYPVQIDHQSIMQVLEEVYFVGKAMNQVFNEQVLKRSFTKLCMHLQYFTYSHVFHMPGRFLGEPFMFVSPEYSEYSYEARKNELQKSMAFAEFTTVWNLLYQIGMPIISNKDYLSYLEGKLTVDMWKKSLFDPQSILNLSKLSSSGDMTMESLKNRFYKSNSTIKKTLKSGSTVWIAHISSLIGNLYDYIGLKKLGTNLIVFSPYFSYIVNHFNKMDRQSTTKALQGENEYEAAQKGKNEIDSDELGFLELSKIKFFKTKRMKDNFVDSFNDSLDEKELKRSIMAPVKAITSTKDKIKKKFLNIFNIKKMMTKPNKMVKVFLCYIIPAIIIIKMFSPVNIILIGSTIFGLGFILKKTKILPMMKIVGRKRLIN